MKKIIIFLFSICLLLIMPIIVFAANEKEDGLTVLADEIIQTTNDLYKDKLPREIIEDDLDFGNVFKIYVGVNIFSKDIDLIKDIPKIFGADGYIYELPIYLDNNTVIVNISKGQPLNENVEFTNEERSNILKGEGKWQVTAIKYYENKTVDYRTELKKRVGTVPEDTVLVGGLPYFRYAVALIPNTDGRIEGIVPLSDVPGVEKIKNLRIKTNKMETDDMYDYQNIREYINELPKISGDEAGPYGFLDIAKPNLSKNNNSVILVLLVGVIFVCGITIFFYKNKKTVR